MTQFEWADAWILSAAIWAAEEHSAPNLEDLLACSDAINKAIPTTTELSGAFTRLVAGGLAEQVGGTIKPTESGLSLLRSVNPLRQSAFEEVQRLANALRQIPARSGARPIVVTDEALDAAYRKYDAFANQIIEKTLQDLGKS